MAVSVILSAIPPAIAEAGRPTITIGGSVWIGDGPTKVADALDLFNRSLGPGDPRIEVLNLGSGFDSMAMLLAGEVDFALSATTPTALALMGAMETPTATSREPVVLASLALSNQSHKLLIHPESGISEPADLRGRRVGIMRATSSHYGWWHFAAFNDLEGDQVEQVHLPVRDMPRALLDHEVDAVLIWEPWDVIVTEALGQAPRVFDLRMIYTVNWLLLTDRQFALDHPQLVERVLTAYRDAIDFMDRDPARSAALQARSSNLTVEELLQRSDGILWRIGLNWSVLVGLGSQFEWLSTWPELAGQDFPEPRHYLLGAPLARIAPELVTLPPYLLMDAGADGVQR